MVRFYLMTNILPYYYMTSHISKISYVSCFNFVHTKRLIKMCFVLHVYDFHLIKIVVFLSS